MKKYLVILTVLITGIFVLSCSKGDMGPTGPDGGYVSTAVFQTGVNPSVSYDGCADAGIQSDFPNNGMGGCYYMLAGYDNGGAVARALIKFDPSFIVPSNVTVTSAELTLTLEGTYYTGSVTITAYALSNDWTEGSGGCGATGDLNLNTAWNFYDGNSNTWTPGGAYGAAASTPLSVTQTTGNKLTLQLKPSVVQSWINNPDANYGVIIKGSVESGAVNNWISFYASTYSTASFRPELRINYKLPQ